MPLVTTQDLINRASAIADMQDNFVKPTVWLDWATQERRALEILLLRNGWTHNFNTTTITVDGTENGVFSLGTQQILAIVAVHEVTSAGARLLNFNNAVDFLRQVPGSSLNRGHATEYRVAWAGDGLELNFFPEPLAGETYLVTYVRQPNQMSLEVIAPFGFDNSVTYPMGWEERIVLGMARRALIKEESDPRAIEGMIKEVERDIEEVMFSRVLSDTPSVRNVDAGRRGWVARLLFPLWQQWAWL